MIGKREEDEEKENESCARVEEKDMIEKKDGIEECKQNHEAELKEIEK